MVLKSAVITPKKLQDDIKESVNYRPILMILSFSKVLEKNLIKQITFIRRLVLPLHFGY